MVNTSSSYTTELLGLYRGLFSELIDRFAGDDTSWHNFEKALNSHTLLDFRAPSPFKPAPIELDEEKLDDVRYRRYLIRKLEAPRPGKWINVRLKIDRTRLCEDEYRHDVAGAIAAKWLGLLGAPENEVDALVLTKLNADFLLWFLTEVNMSKTSAGNVAALFLRRTAEDVLDENPKFIALMDRLRAELGAIREKFTREIREITERHIAESRRRLDEIAVAARESGA